MSRLKCCVPICLESGHAAKVLHVFPSPLKDKDRFNAWLYAIGGEIIGLDNEFIFKQRRVCHNHFEEKYHCRNNRISNNAIPTLHMGGVWKMSRQVDKENEPYINSSQANINTEAKNQFLSNVKRKQAAKPECDYEENGATEVNLSQPQQGIQLFDGDAVEDVPDAGDIHSDDGDKETEGNQFSWQKSAQICIDDDDDFGEVPHVPTLDIEVKPAEYRSEASEEKPKDTISEDHKEYFCDSCTNSIVGPRYRCVECDNYDLCSRCEARHARHYMLRIPRPRPFSEIQSIIDTIREKIKEYSKELTDNSLGLDEIKLEPDFIDPAALDPLCTPRVQTPLPPHETSTHNAPQTPLYRKTYKPVYAIKRDSTQKPKVAEKDTQKPQTAPVETDLLKKQKLVKDNENTHNDTNTSKRKLTTFIEESFLRDKRFKDTEKTLEHRVENVHDDGNTSGKGFKRKDFEDMEETWLDEDILDEEVILSSEELEDCEESPSARVTRSTIKNKQLSDENAPDT